MRSIRALLFYGLIWLPASLFAQAASAPPSARASAPPSAPSAPAASAVAVAAPVAAAAGTSAERLRREIDALRGLLDGRLPQTLPLSALFEIDLSDAGAVALRAQALGERIATPIEATQGDEMVALRAARDGLRLSFLNLPAERRDALREQDRLKRQGQALAAEQEQAAAAVAATEEARDSALTAATEAVDNTARLLATEEARLLAHLSELSSLRQGWVEHKQRQLAKYQGLLARFGADGANPVWPPAVAAQRYAEVREVLRQLRAEADASLSMLTAPSAVVASSSGPALDFAPNAAHDAAMRRVSDLRARIVVEEVALKAREVEARYSEAEDVMNALGALQARRIEMLPMLDAAQRYEATGFTSEGWARVLSEVDHLRLMARWYPVQRLHEVRSFSDLLHDSLTAGRYGASALGLTLLLVGLFLLRQRVRGWLLNLQRKTAQSIAAPTLRQGVNGALQTLALTAKEWILLLAVFLVFDLLLVGRAGLPELGTLRSVAYAYAWYRLALALIHRVLLVALSRYHAIGPALNAKILRSLRLVARLALAYAVYLILAQTLLGRGALYDIARQVALAGMVFLGWRLISVWRGEVTQAYLSQFPEGRLAERVRASQDRSHGLLIASAAFVFVAGRGLWIWLRDSALRFEQTRKALAYLFRRQLERQLKNQPAAPDPSLLPAALQTALTEGPVTDVRSIDLFPDILKVQALAQRLAGGRAGGLVALSGERGAGKTTWLLALQSRINPGMPCTLHAFEERNVDPAAMCRLLSELLGLSPTDDADTLIAAAASAAPRVLLLDLVQNTMLRAVGGLAAHSLLLRVAQATTGRVLWVLAYARWPFEYLQRTLPGRDIFDQILSLAPWTEAKIGELIETRMAAAGFSADYEQLLANPSIRPATGLAADVAALEHSADRYHRLVWDYADGNPRIALHFFKLSLVWEQGTQVRVRLFATPSVDALEAFETHTWFILACLIQHENLTVDEAAASLRFGIEDCARALQLLEGQGFLECSASGRYRATSHWARALQRFLQRKKMLVV